MLAFLFSCSQGTPETETSADASDQTEEIPQPETIEESGTEDSDTGVTLENFPKLWIRLTCDDSGEGCYIQHFCEAELPQIQIEAVKGEQWRLIAVYGQESESWMIESFSATEKEMELMTVVEGDMVLIPESGRDSEEKKQVHFMWNKDELFCRFEGLFFDNLNYFVAEQDMKYYDELDEDCSGLWE